MYKLLTVTFLTFISNSGNTCFVGNEKESPKQEATKARIDLSVGIFEQLTLPLRDGHTVTLEQSVAIQQSESDTVVNTNEPNVEINVSLLNFCWFSG